MLPWLFALLASVSPAQVPPPAPSPFIVRTWGTADGLPQNTVTSIVQTRDGYLWLGTFGGLVRFDGHAFTVFDPANTPGLASARIVTLLEDRAGVLWIGTEAGLTKYEAGRFTTYTTRDGLPHDEVVKLAEDRQARLWISTRVGVARFGGHAFEPVPLGDLAPPAQGFAETRDGDMWVATWGGVARVRGDQPASIVSREAASAIFADRQGRLWLGSAYGLKRREASGGSEPGRFAPVTLPDPAEAHRAIVSLAEDRDGALWVGTSGRGVYRWRDGTLAASAEGLDLTDNAVRAVFADRGGNVWIGTEVGGLNRLKPRRVFSYPLPLSLGVPAPAPMVGDGADGLWVGAACAADHGGLLHFRAGAFEPVAAVDVGSRCVWSLLRDPDGTLWVGTVGGGLGRLSGGRYRRYQRTSEPATTNLVTAIARGRDGTLWVGSDAGLSRFEDGRFTDVGRTEGLVQRVLCIKEDRRGALWLGTVAGLYRFTGGRFTRYTQQDGLSHDHVRTIHEDVDGVLWIGTYGGGLNRLKDGRFSSFGIREGLPDVAVSRIIEDPQGNLWMSGNKGVFRVARRQLNDLAEGRTSYLTSVAYGTADGMVIEETNGGQPAGWRTGDGRLWFPTIKGLVGIEPGTDPAAPPPVFIERTVVDGRSLDPRASPRLGPGSADAEFHYTAIDLGAAEKTRFRYRLAGYDPGWIDSGARRVAYYTKIPPGVYRFEVMATNSDGVWSATPAHTTIDVAPLWWQRQPVQAAGLLLLLAATALGVRWLTLRRARARVAELEREQALERERSRIARDLHDDLGSRLAQIALIAEDPVRGSPMRIASVAREAMRTMDELVWTVNARNDTVERFAEFAAEFAEEHLSLAGVRCRLHMQPDLGGRLGADTRRHLYLTFKEAVHNVVKHAGASEVQIGLGVERNVLVLEVADNGRGFPADRHGRTGNGLRNMRERMDAAGGTLIVESADGAGTRLVFRVPIGAGPAGT